MHERVLGALLEAADEGVIVFEGGECRFVGRRLGEIFGVDPAALMEEPEADVMKLLASACEEPESFPPAMHDAQPRPPVELELKRPRVRIVRWQARVIDAHGGWLALARDVTRERSAERRAQQLQQRLESITAIDGLTQLPNRRRFLEELDREHGRAARAWDSYAILRLDVDHLAKINDELGQVRGDEILEEIARRLQGARREYDLLARLGDDEFVVLLPGADVHAARVVADRMSAAVANDPIAAGSALFVRVSVGAAVWMPPSGETGPDVVNRAGVALAQAKREGEGRAVIDREQESGSGVKPTSPRA